LIGPNTSQVRIKFGDPDDATIGEVGYNHSINAMRFNTNGAQRMTIDASGNLGLGVSPSAWESSFRAFDILQQSSIAAENNAFNITLNAYYNLAWKYKATGKAQRYVQYDGNYYWYTAPSGTAGNAISFTQAMTLDASGSLGVGTTSLTGYNLRVSKSVTGATTAYGISSEGQIQSDVTSSVRYFTSNATQAAGSTLTTLYHYNATQGTISGTITDQYGYFVQSNLTSATNNYGFYGNIAAGLGRWNVYMAGTANNHMSGSLAIGTTQVTGYNLNIVKNLTGSVDAFGIQSAGQIQSDVTSSANYFQATASQASGFTISNIRCFTANQGTISGTVTNQYGFSVSSGLTGATNNYGFFGNLAAASGRWNLYMNGTAANYLAGNTGIGITSPASALHIDRGNATASYLQFTAGTTTGQASTDGFDVGIDASGNAVLNQQESLAMLFNTNNSERMRITSGGELLINTTSDAGDYKLQVNGNTRLGGLVDIASGTTSSFAFTIDVNSTFSFGSTNGKRTAIIRTTSSEDNGLQFGYDTNDNTGIIAGAGTLNGTGIDFYTYNGTSWGNRMRIKKDGNVEMYGSIKTAAPSGGTAKPWKLGEAGVTLGGSNTSGVRVEIDGTVYYLVTGYLP